MKNIKKFFSVSLIIAMIILTSCSGNKQPGSNNTSGAGNANQVYSDTAPSSKLDTTTTGSKVDQSQLTGRVGNLNGREIRININDPSALDKTTVLGKAREKRDKELEAKFNCKIKYILQQNETAGTTTGEITKSVLAGKPSVDIWVQNGWPELIPHYRSGVIQNLDTLKVFDWSQFSSNVELSNFGGGHYHVSSKIDSNGVGYTYIWATNVLFFNQKLLDQYGITDDIIALQKNGQWTWDKFAQICKTFNQNVGNSNTEIRALYEWSALYDNLLGSYKTDWIAKDKTNGNYIFNGGSDLAQKAQNLYTSLISSGVATIPLATDPNPQKGTGSAFAAGKSAFLLQPLYQMKWLILNSSIQEVKENWNVVSLPSVSTGKENYNAVSNAMPSGYSIPVGVTKPNEVATFLNDWMLVELKYDESKKAFFDGFVNECLNEKNGEKITATVAELYDFCAKEKDTKLLNGFAYLTSPPIGNWNIGHKDSWYTHARSIATGKEAMGAAITSMNDYYNKILLEFTKSK